MINTYLNDLDAFISANDAVADVDVLRRDIRDTGLEKICKIMNGAAIRVICHMQRSGNGCTKIIFFP